MPSKNLPASMKPELHRQDSEYVYSNLQKKRKGLKRLWHAGIYSMQGLQAAWHEKAFRLEVCLTVMLVPMALVIGHNWLEVMALIASVVLVLVVELLNSAIETVVDRISLEWHSLAKKAKDLGSAAVFISLLLCVSAWGVAFVVHFH